MFAARRIWARKCRSLRPVHGRGLEDREGREDVTAILAFSLVAHLEMNLALLGGSDAVW